MGEKKKEKKEPGRSEREKSLRREMREDRGDGQLLSVRDTEEGAREV